MRSSPRMRSPAQSMQPVAHERSKGARILIWRRQLTKDIADAICLRERRRAAEKLRAPVSTGRSAKSAPHYIRDATCERLRRSRSSVKWWYQRSGAEASERSNPSRHCHWEEPGAIWHNRGCPLLNTQRAPRRLRVALLNLAYFGVEFAVALAIRLGFDVRRQRRLSSKTPRSFADFHRAEAGAWPAALFSAWSGRHSAYSRFRNAVDGLGQVRLPLPPAPVALTPRAPARWR